MKTRDMTIAQFLSALDRHGIGGGYMPLGSVNINVPGHHIEVNKYNGGPTRRGQLAYLLKVRADYMAECKECGHIKADHSKLIRNSQNKLDSIPACPKCDCPRFV